MTEEQPSSSFELLDKQIQRWIWGEGWTELRDAQEQAIPAILNGKQDVIIAAATASGKTEAAFFPILTAMLCDEARSGLTVYISPLKALINDQFNRLTDLCESLEIPVFPWHGDIASSVKSRFLKKPDGVLLITPESLEAILCNKGFKAPKIFAKLKYFVVDELHAFIGSERGKQLQSLMQRIDIATGHKAPRIGLSATLGDMRMAANFLRPFGGTSVEIIHSAFGGSELQVVIKGYIEPTSLEDLTGNRTLLPSPSDASIVQHLFKTLRGSNNLIFPNSRAKVESYTYALRQLCERERVQNEFWPHHGSLSREIREETENALKAKDRSTTAICTNTLELGIDIGAVKSIAQIGPPPSVASLRQRLGRSGRRKGESAILRGYAIESEIDARSHLMTQLRENLFEMTAMVSLLLENWFEPPRTNGLHLSTLVQQLLSLISQHGGITASHAYEELCDNGPFNNVNKSDFVELLKHLGEKKLIQQDSSGVLVHGEKGEILVNHYTFYAAFAAEEEFRVISSNHTLGTLPISTALSVGDFILFAARTWRIESIEDKTKTIYVMQHMTGVVPSFNSSGGRVHDHVRKRMKTLYAHDNSIAYLDETASQLLVQGRQTYRQFDLDSQMIISSAGSRVLLFTWLGDGTNEVIGAMLRRYGLTPALCGPAIELYGTAENVGAIPRYLVELANEEMPTVESVLSHTFNLSQEKWDWALPDNLLQKSFASLRLNIDTAYEWIQFNAEKSNSR